MTTTKQYFKECTTLDSAKNLFRKLSFLLHPDTSGSDTQNEFVKMFQQFKNFVPASEHARKDDEAFNHEAFYNIVKRFDSLQDVLITFIGSFIWLEDMEGAEGATKSQKEDIKSILLIGMNPPRFAFKRKKWYYSPEGYKQKFKSNKSFNELKYTWGHKTFEAGAKREEPKKQKQLF